MIGHFSATGTAALGLRIRDGGIENDPNGFYRANARYYSPALTRFLSEHPERGKANLFTYAGENAITGSDIGGMDDCPLGDCAGGGDLGSGGSSGSGDDGFQALIQFLLGPFGNFLSTSWSATPTIMNYAGPQLEAQFGNSFATLGLDCGVNIYTTGGSGLFNPGGLGGGGGVYFVARDLDSSPLVPIPPLNSDPGIPPGPEWRWKGPGTPGSSFGSWVNTFTKWALHPDFDHPPPKGPHYDLQKRGNTHSLRIQGTKLQLWSEGTRSWATIFDFTWLL